MRAALVFVLLMSLASSARAESCDECKRRCDKQTQKCKKADKGLCKVPGVGGVCKMFRNAQCPAAGFVCKSVECGTRPGCDPPGNPTGGGQASGDPHFYSLDRARFDLQGAGEYWLARSKPAGVEIQARMVPWKTSKRVSTLQAIAIRVDDHVVTFGPEGAVSLDRQSIEVPRDGLYVTDSVAVGRASGKRYLLSAPKANIWVRSTSYLNIHLVPDRSTSGTWEGLFGDFDGNHDNDYKSQDGVVYEPANVTPEILYGKFGDSWRIKQSESFLPYAAGQSTATFTNKSFPDRHVSVAELDPATFTRAYEQCRAKGVSAAEALRNCIYDIGVTGVELFADGYALVADVQAKSFNVFGGEFGMRAHGWGYQGGYLPVFWSGPLGKEGLVSIADAAGRHVLRRGTNYGNPVVLRLPAKAGAYTLEFTLGDQETKQPLEVKDVVASIEAPSRVGGAEEFDLTWTGPLGTGDFVGLYPKGEETRWLGYLWASKGKGTLQAPAAPGEYELAYMVQGAGRREAITRIPIIVTAPEASIKPPANAVVGGDIPVEWTGPAGRGDFIDLVEKGHTEVNGWLSYSYAQKNKDGTLKPAIVRAPVSPGTYTLRYIATGSGGRAILTTADVIVEDATVKLVAPSAVAAKSELEISWEGPQHRGDFVTIAKKDQKPQEYVTYKWANRSKATFKAPDAPGIFEIRYILNGPRQRRVLGTRPLVVK